LRSPLIPHKLSNKKRDADGSSRKIRIREKESPDEKKEKISSSIVRSPKNKYSRGVKRVSSILERRTWTEIRGGNYKGWGVDSRGDDMTSGKDSSRKKRQSRTTTNGIEKRALKMGKFTGVGLECMPNEG